MYISEKRKNPKGKYLLIALFLMFSFILGLLLGYSLKKPEQKAPFPLVETPSPTLTPKEQEKPILSTLSDNFFKEQVKVKSIYDGDTFKIDLKCDTPLFCRDLSVRVKGIDTPELKTKDECEKSKALEAKAFSTKFLSGGKLELKNCERDKYFRALCDVFINGESLASALISQGLAYSYDGKAKANIEWCSFKGKTP